MRLRAICKKCDHIISFDATKTHDKCTYCGADLTVKDVRMTPTEQEKYQRAISQGKLKLVEPELEEKPEPKHISAQQRLKMLKPSTVTKPKPEAPKKPNAVAIGDEALRLAEARKGRTVSDSITGKYIIHKGKTKYGHLEVTNPDYMILKLNFWTMGDQQKYVTQQLNSMVRRFLTEMGFELKRS